MKINQCSQKPRKNKKGFAVFKFKHDLSVMCARNKQTTTKKDSKLEDLKVERTRTKVHKLIK